jgi:hypothetical protein
MFSRRLVQGASDPQPHPSFVGLFGLATFHDGYRAVEGAGENGPSGATDLSSGCSARAGVLREIAFSMMGWDPTGSQAPHSSGRK